MIHIYLSVVTNLLINTDIIHVQGNTSSGLTLATQILSDLDIIEILFFEVKHLQVMKSCILLIIMVPPITDGQWNQFNGNSVDDKFESKSSTITRIFII